MRRYFILLFNCIWVVASHAQQTSRMPKVVVKASALHDLNPLETVDKTHITDKDLEQAQAITVVDALRRVPGVYVTQQGGIGQEARVSFRGVGEAYTTTLINGMAINDSGSIDNTPNLSRWLVDDISDIEVIRGPMSSLYGPGGMGGVLLIETKKGRGSHKNFAKAEAGSFQTHSQNIGFQGQQDSFDYFVIGSRIQSMGAKTTPPAYRSQLLEKADNPFHQENVTARLGVGSDTKNVSLISRYITRRLGFRQIPTDPYPYRQNYAENFHRLLGHFETESHRMCHDVGLGFYHNDLTATRPLSSKVTRNAQQIQVDWRQKYNLTKDLQFQLAMDYSKEKLFWYKIPLLNNTFQTSHKGVGGTVTYRVFEPLQLTTSLRADKYLGMTTKPTYRFGGHYILEKVKLKGSIGTAFKAPTLQQKYYNEPLMKGNPNLKPEHSLGWDFGLERPFFEDKLTLSMTVFQNRIRDLIASEQSNGIWRSVNLNKTRTQGIEGLMRYSPSKDWIIELNHIYTDARDEKTKRGIVANPYNKTSLTFVGKVSDAWSLSGNVLYISSRDTLNAIGGARMSTPSYTIVGAETSYQITDNWQMYGRAENLLNRQYQSPLNFQQPGLGIYVGIRAQC